MSAYGPRTLGTSLLLWAHRPAQANDVVSAAALKRGKTMAKTYRDVAIDQMIASVEKAMSHVIDWWATRQHR
jgi:hypothetical protein